MSTLPHIKKAFVVAAAAAALFTFIYMLIVCLSQIGCQDSSTWIVSFSFIGIGTHWPLPTSLLALPDCKWQFQGATERVANPLHSTALPLWLSHSFSHLVCVCLANWPLHKYLPVHMFLATLRKLRQQQDMRSGVRRLKLDIRAIRFEFQFQFYWISDCICAQKTV